MLNETRKDFFNAADYFLDRNIRQGKGHRIAVYTEYKNYTYNDIQKMTNKTANGFRELGVRADDKIMILMIDVPQFYAVFWGAISVLSRYLLIQCLHLRIMNTISTTAGQRCLWCPNRSCL